VSDNVEKRFKTGDDDDDDDDDEEKYLQRGTDWVFK
jgi:hypothetical protein